MNTLRDLMSGGAIAVAGIGFGVALWMAVLHLLGWWSGWRRLAARHPAPAEPPPAGGVSGASAMLGLVSYRGVLSIAADTAHVHLRLHPLFRPGHPPLRVPQERVTVSDGPLGLCTVDLDGARLRLRRTAWLAARVDGHLPP